MSLGKRTPAYILDHVRKRLFDRFALRLTAEQVRALDGEARITPSVGYTQDGKPFKALKVGGHDIYGILGKDEAGQPCLVTVYTLKMFEDSQFFKGGSSSRS